MADFRDMNRLSNFMNNTASGRAVLSNYINNLMKSEARRLEEYIKTEISRYLSSYTPVVYERTMNWFNSLRVGEPTINTSGSTQIRIYFDPVMAYHPSIIGENQPDGYVPWLMEVGWKLPESIQPGRYRFTYFEGTQVIKKAVERYNSSNPYGIRVNVYYGDEKYI